VRRLVRKECGEEGLNLDSIGKQDIYALHEEAANTKWECCCLFAVRSCEVLLEGEIPFDCVSIVSYTTHIEQILALPHQQCNIPFESFTTSVIAEQTCYANGDNGGLINMALKGEADSYLLKQAKRTTLEKTSVPSSREMRSSIDLEFAAFDTYRRVAHYVPEVNVAVRDCIKISFRFALTDLPAGIVWEEEDPVLNCLLFRCLRQPSALMPVENLIFPLSVAEETYKAEYGDEYLSSDDIGSGCAHRCHLTALEAMQKHAKKIGEVLPPEVVQKCREDRTMYYVRHLFLPKECPPLFRGLAVDLLLGNVSVGGFYEKSCIATSRNGRLYRLSAEKALGNQVAESLNADRRDESAGNLMVESISYAMRSEEIPLRTLCGLLRDMLHKIKGAIEAHEDEFFSDAYRHLDLPYDGLRMVKLYPAQHPKAVEYYELFERTRYSLIWKDYLVNRVHHLCDVVDRLAVVSVHVTALKHLPDEYEYVSRCADVLSELRKYLYCFGLGHAPLEATGK
jgi:hypothetical protein